MMMMILLGGTTAKPKIFLPEWGFMKSVSSAPALF